ncbi:hypothetical protein [Cohnella panacarvi]|uniref:hypothetical protein n=1 Tax=Cohnella panacarvi TaxID=400776 RepID=UPI0004791A2C|nr:hypothetical protein [Cohnella panacarvi]
MRIRSLLVIAAITLAAFVHFPPHAAASPDHENAQTPSKLELQIAEWVDALAKQKPFAAWQSADPQIEALGPGTHSWLVLFTQAGENIGYMVVNAALDGSFKLGEYGLGPYPLFSYELLKQSLTNGGMLSSSEPLPAAVTKIYVHPFAAAWEVRIGEETYYLDAKTAEQLPLDERTFPELFPTEYQRLASVADADRSKRLRLNPAFDVYERLPWLMKETPFPAKEVSKLQARLDKRQHLRYVTEPLGDKMLYALSVVGYQRWASGRVDVALDMNGQRFIPLSTLDQDGLFYR